MIATGISELGTRTTVKIWGEEATPDEFPPPGPSREVETPSKVMTSQLLFALRRSLYLTHVTSSPAPTYKSLFQFWRFSSQRPTISS